MWVQFMDMHSGGRSKEPPYEYIYIEADSREEARQIFMSVFEHDPDEIGCRCCGENYAYYDPQELEHAISYVRRVHGKGQTLDEFKKRPDILMIPISERKIRH